MRHLFALVAVSFSFLAGPLARPASAQDGAAPADGHAGRHSADAIAYVEFDAGALLKGLGELDLVRLLDDPDMKAFLAPLRKQLGLEQGDSIVATLQKRVPGTAVVWGDWLPERLSGKCSFALYGVTIRVEGVGMRNPKVFKLNARNPLAAKQVLGMIGELAVAEMAGLGAHTRRFVIGLDFTAVLELGPKLKKQILKGAEFAESNEVIKLAGRDVLKVVDRLDRIEDQWFFRQHFYVDTSGDRWIVASSPERFSAAANRAVRTPLDRDPGFQAVKKRFTGGRPLLFGWLDAGKTMKVVESAVSPLFKELAQKTGLASVQGFGFGVSITNGGIRESLGFVLDGKPTGVWRLLDAFPGGLRSVQVAPPGALVAVALKFDAALLGKRLQEVAAEVVPGTEKLLLPHLAGEFNHATGLDLEQDLFAALGDEVALLVFPKAAIPDVVFGLEVRDEAAFGRILALLKKHAGDLGVNFEDVALTDTIQGVQISNPDLPVPLTFAVANKHLFLSNNQERVVEALTEWGREGRRTLAKDGDVFGSVMKGLTGGGTDNVVALAYLNARGVIKAAANYWPLVTGMASSVLPAEFFNRSRIPTAGTILKYMKGAAIGLRRDADGVTLDAYSPVGLILPSVVSGVAFEMERQARWRRQARARGVVVVPQRVGADLGVVAMRSSGDGVQILGMTEKGPAAQAGLRVDDTIVAFDGKPIGTIDELNDRLAKWKPGAKVTLKVVRDGKETEIAVVPGRR